LKSGNRLLLFPEGTRTRRHLGEVVNEFRGGIAIIARQAGVPVWPVFITTDSDFGRKTRSLWKLPEKAVHLRVRLGEPVHFRADESVDELSASLARGLCPGSVCGESPRMNLAVLIPSYNTGAELLQRTLRGALEAWPEVWVVIDGSTDGSDRGLEALQPAHAGLRILRCPENQGKGAAVLKGAEAARAAGFTHVLTMDADGQHPPGHIPSLPTWPPKSLRRCCWGCHSLVLKPRRSAFMDGASRIPGRFWRHWAGALAIPCSV